MVARPTTTSQRYITFTGSPHGADTYYGRHFFYRARNGSIFTITVPPLGAPRRGAARTTSSSADYPTLRATCEVLDRIGTRLYQNATIPVALAHQYCAYPLAAAGHVLKLHAEEHLDRRRRRRRRDQAQVGGRRRSGSRGSSGALSAARTARRASCGQLPTPPWGATGASPLAVGADWRSLFR